MKYYIDNTLINGASSRQTTTMCRWILIIIILQKPRRETSPPSWSKAITALNFWCGKMADAAAAAAAAGPGFASGRYGTASRQRRFLTTYRNKERGRCWWLICDVEDFRSTRLAQSRHTPFSVYQPKKKKTNTRPHAHTPTNHCRQSRIINDDEIVVN